MDHDHGSTSSTSSTSTSSHGMMIPYLHFEGGDNLLFKAWAPTSAGAIAGACIGLVLVALLERWLYSLRSLYSEYWRRRALSMYAERDKAVFERLRTSTESEQSKGKAQDKDSVEAIDRRSSTPPTPSSSTHPPYPLIRRTVSPFIASFDIPRGIFFSLQMLLVYTLMLAVMTFQAAYIISIVIGLGLGEILFGRAVHQSAVH